MSNKHILERLQQEKNKSPNSGMSSARRIGELLGHTYDDSGNVIVPARGTEINKTSDLINNNKPGLGVLDDKIKAAATSQQTTPKDIVMSDLIMSDGSTLGKITKGGLEAIEKKTLNSYTPKNDEEKSTIEKYKQIVPYVDSSEIVEGNDVGLKYTGEQAGWSLKGVWEGLKNTFRDVFAQQMEQTKNDPTMHFAENTGMIKKGYNEGYAKVVDKQVEGIYADIKKSAEEHAKQGALIDAKYPDLSDTKRTAGKLVGGSAQVLPMIAASAVNPALGTMLLGSQVYGNSLASAYAEGAELYEARAYAGAEAVKEMAIEKVFGGLPFTKGFADDVIAPVANKIFTNRVTKELAKGFVNVVGEGAEELAAELITPYIKRAIYDKDAPNASAEDLAFSFMSGVIPSLILGGASTPSKAMQYKKLDAKIDKYNASIDLLPESVRPQSLDKKTTTLDEYNDAVGKLQVVSKKAQITAEKDAALAGIEFFKSEIPNIEKSSIGRSEKAELINGYTTQMAAYSDYVRDMDTQLSELALIEKGKGEDIVNANYSEPFKSFSSLNPTHIDSAVGVTNRKGFVNIKQLDGGKFAVTNIDGEVVIKTAEQVAQRYLSAESDATAKKLINQVTGKAAETVQAEKTAETVQPTQESQPAKAVPHNVLANPTVAVGDVFKDTKYGGTITVVGNEGGNTTVLIDTGAKTETRTLTNEQASRLVTSEQYTPVVQHSAKTTENAAQTTATPNLDAEEGNNTTEGFKIDSDGKIRFSQTDIDYSNTKMRKGQFKVRGVGKSSRVENGHLRGKYGIFKRDSGMYSAVLLQAGTEVGQFKTLTEAKKAVTYLDANFPFNNVEYTQEGIGNYKVVPSEELKDYISSVKQVIADKPYNEVSTTEEVTESAETITEESAEVATAEAETSTEVPVETAESEAVKATPTNRESVEVQGKGTVKWDSLHPKQQMAITFMEGLAKAANMDLVLTANAPFNGGYDIYGGTIYLDVFAGTDPLNNINDTIIPTASHELTHWMKFQAPALWNKLSASVFKALEEVDGISKADRIATEVEKLKNSKFSAANEVVAEDEIVSRACEDMLRRSEQGRKLFDSLSASEQKTIMDKIKEIIKNLKDWVSDMLTSYESHSYEATALRKCEAKLDEISKLWDAAFAESVEVSKATQKTETPINKKEHGKYAAEFDMGNKTKTKKASIGDKVLEQNGLQYDRDSKSIAPTTLFSERTWTASEYVQDEETAVKAIVKAVGVSEADARRYIKNINSIARYIADNRDRLDYEPNVDDFATVLKSNKEYKWTVDMSTLCAKRLLYTGTFDAIQKKLPDKAFTSEDMVALRSMMAERGYEVACGICYVESTRRELGTITADFIDRYKLSQKTGKAMTYVNSKGEVKDLTKSQELMEKSFDKSTNKFIADKGYTPTLADLNTTDIDKVKTEHPLVYEAYVAFMKARGQATPKLLETRTEYKGEILKHFKSKTAVKSRNDAGGLRVQSFSDFEIAHLIDMMQIALDMSRVGLMSQAYTKVPAFADVFGDTGIKINLSLIAKDSGLDADGNLIFDDVEGMPHEEAFRLRDKHSKNVGTILVGKNDAHIKAALADPRIDFIIPFHKSFWKESLYEALGLEGYTDYTDTQNEKPYDKGRKIKNFHPSEYWDYNKSGEENAKTYLKMCEEDRRHPKFPQFQNEPGYWKLLIDFKMYDNDGVGSPQTVVKPEFDMEAANRILNEYKGGHQQFPVAQDVVDDFVAQYKDGNGILYSERGENSLLPNDTNNGKIASHNLSESGDENGRNNEEKTGGIGGRVGRVSEELGDKGRRDSSDSGDVSIGISALDSEEKRESVINYGEGRKGSGSIGVDVGASSRVSTDASGRKRTDGERFLEAVNSGDEKTARELLDKQAERNGFVLANVYHGTRAEEAFTKFNEGAAIWVSTSKEYAERYASENTSGVKSYLFTEEDSAVYDLYVKHGNVLDLGNINEEFASPAEMLMFGEQIGFSKDDIIKCFNAGRKYESYAKWTLSITPEFAEIARSLGYDSLRATEKGGVETYGILYPENVKSAKTVTYDEDNNIIPLDERFNTKKNNILYSERETAPVFKDSEGNTLTEAQQEYFKDSKVRDGNGNLLVSYHGTDTKFSVFDYNFISQDNKLGFGFYFMAGKKLQFSYGYPMKVYLNIKNPITDTSKTLSKEKLTKFCNELGIAFEYDSNDYDLDVYTRLSYSYTGETKTFLKSVIGILGVDGILSKDRSVAVSFDPNQIKLTSNTNPTNDPDILYSERETAPTFYSHMAKTIDGIKQDKIGADSVVSYLKGRGVKNEEIKWSGIESFLEGKKSVTKAELQEFAKNSMLQIETKELTSDSTIDYTDDERKSLDELAEVINEKWEEMDNLWLDKYGEEMPWDIRYHDNNVSALNYELIRRHKKDTGDESFFSQMHSLLDKVMTFESNQNFIVSRAENRTRLEKGNNQTKHDTYSLDGGSNYRELLFKLPGSTYSNAAMSAHWGDEGVLAHARVQDFEVDGKKMLFIEEIQSDWHNAGHKEGYRKLGAEDKETLARKSEVYLDNFFKSDLAKTITNKAESVGYEGAGVHMMLNYLMDSETFESALDVFEGKGVKFSESEMAKLDEFRQGYEEIRHQWENAPSLVVPPDAPFRDNYHEYVLKSLLRIATEQGYDSIGWTPADVQIKRWSDKFAKGYKIEYDQDIPKFLNKYGKQWDAKVGISTLDANNTKVWSMDITDAMKNSVLYEGQPLYSLRDDGVPDLFEAFEEATKATTPKTTASSGVKSMAATPKAKENVWVADDATTTPDAAEIPPLSELVNDISNSFGRFGLPIKTGKVANSKALGIYKVMPEVIRTRISNDIPTIIHELGHHLSKHYGLEKSQYINEADVLVDSNFLAQYSKADVPGELAAEFVRRYFKNPDAVAKACPNLTQDFLNSLDKNDAKAVSRIAPKVHTYMSADVGDRYGATIIDSKAAKRLDVEDLGDISHDLYTKWIDKFHPIKQLVDFVADVTGKTVAGAKNAYTLATNSLNAHSIANFVLLEKFRGLDGNVISGYDSFVDCVKDIDLTDDTTQKAFSEYLKLKHALEVQAQNKRVFADENLGDSNNISKRINALEQKYPKFKSAAQKVYDYQHNVLTEFAVKSGLMTQEQADFLRKTYPCYVPFYRHIKGSKGSFIRRALANQKSPVKKMKGSGLDTLDPLENIITNTERIISAALKHQTVDVLSKYADTVDGVGTFIERIPPDQVAKTVGITDLKEKFTDELQHLVKNSNDYFAISDLLDEVFGDAVTGFSPVVNENKGIIAVQRGGETVYYQVHNRALLESLTETSPRQMSRTLKFLSNVMGKTNALITQLNPKFSAMNPFRDFNTAYDLGNVDNPVEFIKDYVKAAKLLIFDSDGEEVTRYRAMGGGHSSHINAELGDIAKSVKDIAMKDKGLARRAVYAITHHPIQLLTAFSDFTESVPRFMTFMSTYNKTGDLQEAIYQADDITTNFKRRGSGTTAKVVNSIFRFNNAALQGLDKTARTIADADSKRRVQITAKWLTKAVLMAILLNFFNRKVDEEGYENLSAYKKNNFYNLAIGDGEFISIPKERENGVIDSLVERTVDAMFGEDDSFYAFGEYLTSMLLPPMLPSTLNPVGASHEWLNSTVIGPFTDIGYNENFMGTPIESDYEKDLPSNERYSEGSTTKLAYSLGQTKFAVDNDLSPKKIDHLISGYFGFLANANKALFPMDKSKTDISMGILSGFTADSNYSTDLLNKVYDNRDLAERDYKYYGTADKAVEYEQNAIMADYISEMNKAIRSLPEDEQRTGRAYLLKSLNSWKYVDTASQTDMVNNLGDVKVSEDSIFSSLPDSTLSWTVNKKKYTYQMTPQEYQEYVDAYMNEMEKARKHYGSGSVESLEQAKAYTKERMSKYKSTVLKNKYIKKATAE